MVRSGFSVPLLYHFIYRAAPIIFRLAISIFTNIYFVDLIKKYQIYKFKINVIKKSPQPPLLRGA